MADLDLSRSEIFALSRGGVAGAVVGAALDLGFGQAPDEEPPTTAAAPKAAKKRRPRPKFEDKHLLEYKNGLRLVLDKFPKATFVNEKGKELQNLKKLLNMYREWAYTLFPPLCFEDFVDKCETLGNTWKVKEFMDKERHKRDFPEEAKENKDEEPVEPPQSEERVFDDDAFEEMMRMEGHDVGKPKKQTNEKDAESRELEMFLGPSSNSQPVPPPLPAKSFLSEKDKERIARNREMALKRKQERLRRQNALKEIELKHKDPEKIKKITVLRLGEFSRWLAGCINTLEEAEEDTKIFLETLGLQSQNTLSLKDWLGGWNKQNADDAWNFVTAFTKRTSKISNEKQSRAELSLHDDKKSDGESTEDKHPQPSQDDILASLGITKDENSKIQQLTKIFEFMDDRKFEDREFSQEPESTITLSQALSSDSNENMELDNGAPSDAMETEKQKQNEDQEDQKQPSDFGTDSRAGKESTVIHVGSNEIIAKAPEAVEPNVGLSSESMETDEQKSGKNSETKTHSQDSNEVSTETQDSATSKPTDMEVDQISQQNGSGENQNEGNQAQESDGPVDMEVDQTSEEAIRPNKPNEGHQIDSSHEISPLENTFGESDSKETPAGEKEKNSHPVIESTGTAIRRSDICDFNRWLNPSASKEDVEKDAKIFSLQFAQLEKCDKSPSAGFAPSSEDLGLSEIALTLDSWLQGWRKLDQTLVQQLVRMYRQRIPCKGEISQDMEGGTEPGNVDLVRALTEMYRQIQSGDHPVSQSCSDVAGSQSQTDGGSELRQMLSQFSQPDH